MDFEGFSGYEFDGDGRPDSALVQTVYGEALVQMPTESGTRYTGAKVGKIYTHNIETFIPELSAYMSSNLELGTRKKFIVIWKALTGRTFTFGYETGASLTYTSQTADNMGSTVTLSARSKYPLFEVKDGATIAVPKAVFDIDFNLWASCEII